MFLELRPGKRRPSPTDVTFITQDGTPSFVVQYKPPHNAQRRNILDHFKEWSANIESMLTHRYPGHADSLARAATESHQTFQRQMALYNQNPSSYVKFERFMLNSSCFPFDRPLAFDFARATRNLPEIESADGSFKWSRIRRRRSNNTFRTRLMNAIEFIAGAGYYQRIFAEDYAWLCSGMEIRRAISSAHAPVLRSLRMYLRELQKHSIPRRDHVVSE